MRPLQPGISFMEQPDQTEFFMLHLPHLWRTPADVDSHFGPPINRQAPLETDWYAHPVNLVVRRPAHSALQVLEPGTLEAPALRKELRHWLLAHHADRSTYRKQARSNHGRVEPAGD